MSPSRTSNGDEIVTLVAERTYRIQGWRYRLGAVRYEIEINVSKGFWPVRIRRFERQENRELAIKIITEDTRVLSFTEDNGVFFPTEIQSRYWEYVPERYDAYDLTRFKKYATTKRSVRLEQVALNEPIPESVFKLDFPTKTGVFDDVNEKSYVVGSEEAPDSTPWIHKRARTALIGQPAPPFRAESRWLNSDPLSWDKLKGKIVVLDFFSYSCGPCRGDFPFAKEEHKKRAQTGIIVIGVHPRCDDEDMENLKKLIKEFDIQYPIVIDTPSEKGVHSWGRLFDEYKISLLSR